VTHVKVAFAGVVAAALGIIAASIWIGTQVREEPIVSNPYEEGLRYDAERHARAALGWDVALPPSPAAPGPLSLAFQVRDRAGAPVEGARVHVWYGRPDTSRGERRAEARPAGAGRYTAPLELAAPGPWLVRFDVHRGADRVQVERVIEVGGAACDAAAAPCTRALPDGAEVTLDLGPRPVRTMRDLSVATSVRAGGAPVDGARVEVAFSMKGMDMGPNVRALAPEGAGRYRGAAVLVRCPSGRRDWTAEVKVSRPGAAPAAARFDLTVAE
jgi:nitrogen fixation protein FixH